MASLDRNKAACTLSRASTADGRDGFGSSFLRYAARRPAFLTGSLCLGFAVGLAYRGMIDLPVERTLANFVRSGAEGVGIVLTTWTVQFAFAWGARSRLGAVLRRLPLAVEFVIRAVVTAAALIVATLLLEAVLYTEPYGLDWLNRSWLTVDLPRIVAISFGLSLIVGVLEQIWRLVGGQLLTSVLLGTYHRPSHRQLIVMFLDLANSTRLAESLGEVRVHDLITRFFFDIDEPIAEFGGTVHAYVGDEAIVSWPIGDDPARNARCVACFFAIEAKMGRLAAAYEGEFGVRPAFRAGMHAGSVVISECGNMKRQLAYFGDTMNVAARLCEYCKTVNRRLVISGDLARLIAIPEAVEVGEGKLIEARGREQRVEVHVVERWAEGGRRTTGADTTREARLTHEAQR